MAKLLKQCAVISDLLAVTFDSCLYAVAFVQIHSIKGAKYEPKIIRNKGWHLY